MEDRVDPFAADADLTEAASDAGFPSLTSNDQQATTPANVDGNGTNHSSTAQFVSYLADLRQGHPSTRSAETRSDKAPLAHDDDQEATNENILSPPSFIDPNFLGATDMCNTTSASFGTQEFIPIAYPDSILPFSDATNSRNVDINLITPDVSHVPETNRTLPMSSSPPSFVTLNHVLEMQNSTSNAVRQVAFGNDTQPAPNPLLATAALKNNRPEMPQGTPRGMSAGGETWIPSYNGSSGFGSRYDHHGSISTHFPPAQRDIFAILIDSAITNSTALVQASEQKKDEPRCKMCKTVFRNQQNARRHMEMAHTEARVTCPFCGVHFKSLAGLRFHKKSLHATTHSLSAGETHFGGVGRSTAASGKSDSAFVGSKSRRGTTSKRFTCNECKATFGWSGNLKRHKDLVHRKLREFPCRVCSRAFGTQHNLDIHMLTHSNDATRLSINPT